MTPDELFLSGMLWPSAGFLIGYRYHVKEARDDLERQERDEAVDRMMARVALRCAERPTNVRCNR